MSIMRRTAAIAALAAGTALIGFAAVRASAVDGASKAASGKMTAKYDVKIADFSFQPTMLNVPVGATVTWTNKDEEPHTVYSTDDTFKSHALDTDEAFSFTFKKAGTYKYFCSVHPKMVATIVVGASKTKSGPMKMDKMDGMKKPGQMDPMN